MAREGLVVNLREIRDLVRVARPPPPYGVRRLARCYSIEDLARAARRRIPAGALSYLEGGGEDEHTLRANRAAFDATELIPRVLRDVADVDTSSAILGSPASMPLALAPVGAPRLFHHEGELAIARAAGRAGVPYAVSTLATVSLEDVARQATASPLWFQLYVWGDRGAAKELLARAQEAGYRAVLLTVDVAVRSKRERELRAGVTLPSPNLSLRTVLEAALHPSWWWRFLATDALTFPNLDSYEPSDDHGPPDIARLFDGSTTWADLAWIRDAWPGALAVKGVLSPEDARHAADLGADAVVVSNHGGRQLDHTPATIDVLPAIADAVGDEIEVILDSGIRRGSDILAALALGARAVLVGRAYLYGLAAAGEGGVSHAIDILAAELRTAMALTGCATVDDIDRKLVRSSGGPASPGNSDVTG